MSAQVIQNSEVFKRKVVEPLDLLLVGIWSPASFFALRATARRVRHQVSSLKGLLPKCFFNRPELWKSGMSKARA